MTTTKRLPFCVPFFSPFSFSLVPLIRLENNSLCPVAMYLRMSSFHPAPPSAPTFTYSFLRGHLFQCTRVNSLNFWGLSWPLQGFLILTISWSQFSKRRWGGRPAIAFHYGVRGKFIQIFGDWTSDAYRAYLEIPFLAKVRADEKMKLRLLQYT